MINGIVLRKVPLNTGINNTWKAVIRSNEGESTAIVKQIPEREIMVECLCAILGRLIGIPIPKPMLLMDEDIGLMFGSEELPHPDLKHSVLPSAILIKLLESWSHLPSACAFDEWIANPDRHGGNILTDGLNNFWLIDHGLALANGIHESQKSKNHLLDICTSISNDDIKKQRLIKVFSQFIQDLPDDLSVSFSEANVPFFDPSVLKLLSNRKQILFTLLKKTVLNHDEIPGF